VQEIPIKPLVVRVPEATRIIERTFVERQTEPLPVTPSIHIEVPATPPPAAPPSIVVNAPERSKDEQNVRGEDAPTDDKASSEKERSSAPTPEVPPVAEVSRIVPPVVEKPVKQIEEPTKPVTPEPPIHRQEKKKRANGTPGRKNTELQHAINWILWEQTGFDKKRCPWRNPYECKKHCPPDENLIEARRFLGFDF
jgi:hypothetical protein